MGGISNINNIRGPSKVHARRAAKNIKKNNRRVVPSVTTKRVVTKKKQKQLERAIKNEKKMLASKGLIELEEEMKDVALPNPLRQRVMNACMPSDEVLAAAAAGPGTILGGPQ
ncbi:uncharacterized protein B0P05DRAFT_546593 [Gilbertella persicaria]|uniref:Uncharacterized protein n=1 Tax=Rhizopus stolonifer TaxID=4846 RepID=A0A367KG50_RHIST|nr:uncharacterized protein B0P05DRAFT_546593 [Gilbertella persicaria]KAI8075835.1 hypothetical protein B0P05DRAFT_546593 [Gilbertella persicaria]RCI01203.1 hypothetical protein CU098_010083 [Rhizopus stolonifer]